MTEQPQKKARPWDLFNKNIEKVNDSISSARMELCLSCEHLIKGINQCKKCGCLMNAKTKLPHAECPVGKWSQERISYKEEIND
jgi:hypothetical protein